MTPVRGWRALRITATLGLLLLPYALLRVPTVRAWVTGFVGFMRTGGALGALALLGFDTGWALFSGPYWLMGTVAGYAYGFPFGIVLAMPAATIAMSVAFVFGKVVIPFVVPLDDIASPRILAVRRAVEAEDFKVALLLRMTPLVPQNVLTYVFATTRLRVRDVAAATACGLLPLTLFYVYLGSVVDDAALLISGQAPDVGPARWFVLGGGVAAGGVALYVIGRIARKALARAMAEAKDASTTASTREG